MSPSFRPSAIHRLRTPAGALLALGLALGLAGGKVAGAQTCTTQAKMADSLRSSIAASAMAVAAAVKSGSAARLAALSAPSLAGNTAALDALVRDTGPAVANDTLAPTQVYHLDATSLPAGNAGETSFACPLTASADEVDFSIAGLGAGDYAFAMVEAAGPRPWTLPMLLEREGAAWKLAGIYPHAASAAGHDGLWFWREARAAKAAGDKWRAWLLYGEAETLLQPVGFVSSSHLETLQAERKTAAPPELSDGLSAATPLVIHGAGGTEFHVTGMALTGSDDGQRLNLTLHYNAEPMTDAVAARARNTAAARALLDAHRGLRTGVTDITVFADASGSSPFATEQAISELP